MSAIVGPQSIGLGESLLCEFPTAGPEATRVVFALRAAEPGPIAIEARSLDFDIGIEVFGVRPDGASALIRSDGNRAPATRARVVLELDPKDGYEVRVRRVEGTLGGEFELRVLRGDAAAADWKTTYAARDAEWMAAEARARQRGDILGLARALRGRGVFLAELGHIAEAQPLLEHALALSEAEAGAEHPEVAASLRALASLRAATDAVWTWPAPDARDLILRALAIDQEVYGTESLAVARDLTLLSATMSLGEARPPAERALVIFERELGPSHPHVAEALHALARVEDFGPEASPLFERALAIREKTLGPQHLDVADSLVLLSLTNWRVSSPVQTQPLLERASRIVEEQVGPQHPRFARVLYGMAMDHADRRARYDDARRLFEQARETWEARLGPEARSVTSTLFQLGWIYRELGTYSEARRVLQRAIAIRESQGWDTDRVRFRLGGVLHLMGHYAEARASLEHARVLFEEAGELQKVPLGRTIAALGGVLLDMGSYEEARAAFWRAVEIMEPEPDAHYVMTPALYGLARIAQQSGSLGEAKALLARALEIEQRTNGAESPQTASALNQLAELLFRMGDVDESRRFLDRAREMRERLFGADHPAVADSLESLARQTRATGERESALWLLERSAAIRAKALGSDHPLLGRSSMELATLLWEMGDIGGTLEHGLRAESITRDHVQLTARALGEERALRYAAVRDSGLDAVLSAVTAGSAVPTESIRLAWDALARSRALVLDEMAGRNRAARESSELGPLLRELGLASESLANLTVRGLLDASPEEYAGLLNDAREAKSRAEERLAAKSASYRASRAQDRVDLAAIEAALPPGGVLVGFVRFRLLASPASGKRSAIPSYAAFVMRGDRSNPAVALLGSTGEIDMLVEDWRQAVTAIGPGGEDAYRRIGDALRRRIWDPIAPAVDEARHLFVVPDGALNLVSLAALPVGNASGYLVEDDHYVHYLSAERDLVLAGAARSGSRGLLAVGGPDYDEVVLFDALRPPSRSIDGPVGAAGLETASVRPFRGTRSSCVGFGALRFDPLPASGREAREVADLWNLTNPSRAAGPGTNVALLTGPDASETAFKTGSADQQVLHVATHGFFLGGGCASALDGSRDTGRALTEPADTPPPLSGENPLLLSGLVFAGANHRSAAGADEDDGVLTAEEIASLDLSGVEWAVLSACDTGIGDVRAGEGVLGLRRAFQLAGAQTVIMSLWAVEDESARIWMRALYETRLVRRLDTSQSVREAMLKVLRDRRGRGSSTHPFYWAGFVAAGNWR